jgi:hypothetical protein
MRVLIGTLEAFGILASLGVVSFLAARYKRDNTASENTDSDNESGGNH